MNLLENKQMHAYYNFRRFLFWSQLKIVEGQTGIAHYSPLREEKMSNLFLFDGWAYYKMMAVEPPNFYDGPSFKTKVSYIKVA